MSVSQQRQDPPAAHRPLGPRMRWMPSYGDGDRLPAVPSQLWFRFYSWKAARDGAHPCAMRMARHLTAAEYADEAGRIHDIAAAIEGYAAFHQVSTRVGWTDRKRLMARGWLREQVAPTAGRKAVYRLCVDPAELDFEAMPVELAHAFARLFGLPISDPAAVEEGQEHEQAPPAPTGPGGADSRQEPPEAAGRDEDLEIDLGPVPGSLAFAHHHLAGCEVARIGGATQRCRYSAASSGRLHTTPLPKRLFSPSLRTKPSQTRRRRSEGVKISLQERAAAEAIMRRCWASWCAQRPGGPPLTPADWRRLVDVVAHALRAADNPADVREELTQRIGSARHLPTLLAYRARRIIHRGHRPTVVPTLRPETLAARQHHTAGVRAGAQATRHAAAMLEALRDDLAAKRPLSATQATPAPLVTDWATEPDPGRTRPLDPEQADQRRRHALALRRARRERAAAQKISSEEWGSGKITKPPAFTT